jgi:hypothetical protein
MARIRVSPALALLLVPFAVFAQSEFTAPPSGPAIVAPAQGETIYGTPYKPGQPYKPPVAKPPTVPKPASAPPPVYTGDRPGIYIPTNPSSPSPTPVIPLPGTQTPVIVKPAPSIPLPGTQTPVIVKPSPSPAIPLPGQGPVIVTPAPPSTPATATPKPEPYTTKPPVTTTTKPEPYTSKPPVTATPKPEPITSKPPATATSAPPPSGAKPTETPPPKGLSPKEEERERERREALAAEAAHRARQEAAAAAERAKKGLAYPDVQPMTPGTAVNVAPQTEPPSSGAIKGLGAKIQQLQKEAAIPPKAPAAKPPANDCDPATPEQCAAIERQLERQKRRLQDELRRERERAEREQRRLDREADRRAKNAQREANRQEREAQRERERNLGKDADDIGRERDRLEGRREARDSKSRDLREQEQKLRRGGDPNCQSAECAKIRGQLTDLQKERQGDLKAETDLQRKGEKFDSEYRRYRAERDDLEKRLDRGEGLSTEEHKDRMEAKERNRIANELDRRESTLEQKSRDATAGTGPPLTRAESTELTKLRTQDAKGDKPAQAMRHQASDAAERIEFDKLSGRSTGELRETARELGRGAQQLGDLEKRVGMGGEQPPAGDGAPSARETALQKERAKLSAAMESASKARNNLDVVARDYHDAERKADADLREAKKNGAPADEISRLERRLTLAKNDEARGKRNAERASRDNARAASGSESLAQREEAAALANAGGLAAGVVNDFNRSLGDLVDEKGNVRQDEVRKQVAQTERSLQQLDKAAPGSPEQKQAIDQLSRQGLDFQIDGGGKVTSWSARTPYAGAVGDAAHDAARLAALEGKPAAQLTAAEKPELQSLRDGRAADREAVRRANQPAAPVAADAGGNSLTDRFKREARSGQTFQQWYAEEQQRVAGPATSAGQRQDAAEVKQRQAGAALDREAAQRASERAGAQRAADDRAAERYMRYGRVEGDAAKPAAATSAPAATPGAAADASAQRDADAAARKVAASDGGLEAWRASRDRQNQDRLAELEKKNSVSGAEKQEIGRLRVRLDESRQRQEAERAPKPEPERAAAEPQRGSAPTRVVNDHIYEELERTRRASEALKDRPATDTDRLRAEVNRTEAEINSAVRDGTSTDELSKRLSQTRGQLVTALQRDMADAGAASSAERAASLESRQQEDERKRGEQLAAAARRTQGGSAVVPGQVASAPARPTTTPEERAANAAQRNADEAAAAQKRKEEAAERERRAEQDAKERALRFGTLPADAFKPIDPAPAAAAAEERRAGQAQRDLDLAAAAERRRREMAAAEAQSKRDAGERILKYGGSAPPAAAAPVKPEPLKLEPLRNEPPVPPIAAIKRDPLPLVPPTPPSGYVAEPQPTARPNDAAPANSQPLGEGDPQARERYLAALQQQIEKRLDGSEFARTAIPAMVAAFADQLGPEATDALLAAVFARLPAGKVDAARFFDAIFTEVDARAAAGGDAEAARASRLAHALALDALVNQTPPGSAGLSEAQRATLSGALHALAQKLIDENRALAASGSDPVAQAQSQADILKLSGMLGPQDQSARTTAEAAAKSLAQLMAGLKSDPSRVALPGDLANALQALERSLATLPAVEPATMESLVGSLGDGYHALAESLRRASGGDPAAKAALLVDAEGREARARLATGRAVDALAALAPRAGEDASTAAARSGQRAALLERIVTLYPGLSPEERARIGDIEKLKAERIASLRSALATERDPARIAGHAVPLIRALEAADQAADALKTASDTAARAPNDDMLQGEKLRLQLLAQGTAPGDAAKLLEGVPAEARPVAVVLALDGLAQAGRVDLIDALAAAAAASLRSNPTLANALAVQADLAAVDALSLAGGDPRALSDRIAGARSRLSLESGLPLDIIRTFSAALDQVEARARAVQGWRQSLQSGTPPIGGFLGMAREALQAGRLDIAADAVNRSLAGLGSASGDVALRQLAEAQALSAMVSQRLAAQDVSAGPRAAGNAFLAATGDALRKGLAELSANQRKLLDAALEARGNTPQTQENFGAEYDAALQRLREAARLRLELELPSLNAQQRDQRFAGGIGDLNRQIDEKMATIRKDFAGQREDVLKGEPRQRLDRRLAEVDALRAERDGLRDGQMDGLREVEITTGYDKRNVAPRSAELWDIERRLTGWSQQLRGANEDMTKQAWRGSLAARMNNLKTDRAFDPRLVKSPDNWLETLLAGNEVEYLERRRAQVVMEDPRLSGEARRAALEGSYRYEADAFKKFGESFIFGELSGMGQAEIGRARQRYAQIENQRQSWLRADLERAGKSGDPQTFFRSLVGLREAQLAGQIETYASYLNDDWTTRGPVKGARITMDWGATGAALDAASVADAQLHPALIRAGHRPPSDLSAEDRRILTDAGFMRDGRYVIPRGAVEDMIRVSTAGTDFAKESTVDKYVNFRKAVELAATVVLPGGFSSRIAGTLVSRVGMRELAKATGARQAAGVIATWAGSRVASKVVEAGLFTVTSRAARSLLDPAFVLDQMAGGWSGLGAEYAHNLMVIGALGVAGSGMNMARRSGASALGARIADKWAYTGYQAATGAALIVTEAALLTGLDRLASGNAISQEDFIGNLLTVGMLKAAHGPGADLRGGGGEIGQLGASQRRYEAWNREQVYVRLANSPAGEMLRNQFGGSWDAARKAHKAGKISDAQMDMLLELRGTIVDRLIAEIKGELGGDATALGSVNRSSDYDLSFSGPKAELAVLLFNARFGNAWRTASGFGGSEAAARLDTNLYTRPVFDEIGRGGEVDAWVQEGFAQLQARRNMDGAQWKAHVADTLSGVVEPARRARMEELLNRVDQRHAEFEKMVAERLPSAAAELGLPRESPDANRAARNRLYEDTLLQILGLKEARAKTTDKAQLTEIEISMRQLQSRALYFAAEAYLTQAAINHVVDSVQSSKRSINASTLLADAMPGTGEVFISETFARQSLVEQKGYIAHYLHLGGAPIALSLKVGKYFIRVLDAMQLAGRKLASREELVRLTGLIDARRGGKEESVARALAAREMIRELRLKPSADRAELDRLEQRLQTERDAYDKAGKAEKEERALAEDSVTGEVLDRLTGMGGGAIDAAANRAAARYNQMAEQSLRDFTIDLSRTQSLDLTAQQRFRKRRKPKTRAWLLRRQRRLSASCG